MKKIKILPIAAGTTALFVLTAGLVLSHGSNVKAVKATGTTVDLSTLTADYVANDGDVLTGTLVGDYKIEVADKASVTISDVTINGKNVDASIFYAGITLQGDGTIKLDGNNTVKGFYRKASAIFVPEGKTLTIDAINETASLDATSFTYGAAIGGHDGVNCGNIVINGGIIVTHSTYSSGIGGGMGADCGDITINGGDITAKPTTSGSGIGSAEEKECGKITINNGKIDASSPAYSAAIGAAQNGKCGDIVIKDGDINAYSDAAGSAIGGASGGQCGDITIEGGKINATANDLAAGIGSGYDDNSVCGDITINGGEITATASDAAAIGAGYGANSVCGDITITGGNVTATVSSSGVGAGIGAGYYSHGGDILISGGNVTAIGGQYSAGIGCGRQAEVKNIVISGGTVTATGTSRGAGIGSSLQGKCGTINIQNTVTLVTAYAGDESNYSVGPYENEYGLSTCGQITIGGEDRDPITTNPFIYPNPHAHEWSYVADGSSITATCATPDCPITEGLTLTLKAPIGDLHYDANAKVATLEEGYSDIAFPNPEIKYFKDSAEVSQCVNVGKYIAKVTYGKAVAMVEFEILGKEIVDPNNDAVTVEADDVIITKDVELRVEVRENVKEKDIPEKYNVILQKLTANEEIAKVYDVRLIEIDEHGVETEIQPSDLQPGLTLKVHMAIPEGLDVTDMRILHIHALEDMEFVDNFVKEGNDVVFEISKLSQFAFIKKVDTPNAGLPGWAIALIIVGSILLLCLLCFFLLFFVFNKWIRKEDKAIRAVKFGKKDNKVRLLVMPFKFEYREESQIFNSKSEALK